MNTVGVETSGDFSNGVVTADFNGDGRLDLVNVDGELAGQDRRYEVSLFLNTTAAGGSPNFAQRYSLGAGGSTEYGGTFSGIRASDFNQDGKPDLAIYTPGDTISVLLNGTPQGAFVPQFGTPLVLSAALNTNSIVVADFDGDRKPDIAVANLGSITTSCATGICSFQHDGFSVAVLLNTTPPGATVASFAKRQEITGLLAVPGELIATDLNSDARMDLVVRSVPGPRGGSSVFFLLNSSSEGADPLSFVSLPSRVDSGVTVSYRDTAADFNNDDLPELIVEGRMYVNITPAGAFQPSFSDRVDLGPVDTRDPLLVETDADVDGRPDLVVSLGGLAPRASVLLNETVGSSTPSFAAPAHFEGTYIYASGDFTGDGKHELIGASGARLLVGVLPFLPATLAMFDATGTILPATDTIPDPFRFTDRSGVARGTTQTSNIVTVRGINTSTPIAVSGGSYSINDGAFGVKARRVKSGDRLRVRHISSNRFGTAVNTRVTIGVVTDTFTSTTLAADTTPNRFDFVNRSGVQVRSNVVSNTVTIGGLSNGVTTSLRLSNGAGGDASFSINGEAFVKGTATVRNGDKVRLRNRVLSGTTASATINIGGVTDGWRISTQP